jgi:hypothetical protein
MVLDVGFKAGHSSPRAVVFWLGQSWTKPKLTGRMGESYHFPIQRRISTPTVSLQKYGDMIRRIGKKFAADPVTTASSITSHIEEPYAYGNHRAALI